jgi:hypothetical protein
VIKDIQRARIPIEASANYREFVSRKHRRVQAVGIDVAESDINPLLFDWQRRIVQWALHIGRAALFEECGLGKTPQQLEWAKHIAAATGQRVLICAPLAVAQQTIREGRKFDIACAYATSAADITDDSPRIIITNYERVSAFPADGFAGVVLDESSILKNFTGKTKKFLLSHFANTPYRLCCTATPAPNDHMELGNHADFLGLMPSNEMLMRWFINDTMNFGSYRLKKHAEADFWRWVASWAVCASKPSDVLGNDDGFRLEPLDAQILQVSSTMSTTGDQLFPLGRVSATSIWRERASNITARIAEVQRLVEAEPDEPWVLWCDTNDESDALRCAIPDALEVRGSDTPEKKEARLLAFANGTCKRLITKPEIAGFGMNWQHCARQAFVGVTFSFERTYQALRRSWRFGQRRAVRAFFIHAEGEAAVLKSLRDKEAAHAHMQAQMAKAMRASGLLQRDRMRLSGLSDGAVEIPSWLRTKSA